MNVREIWKSRIEEQIGEKEIIDLVRNLVSSPSHDGISRQETETATKIHKFFAREGIDTQLIPVVDGRCNVIARMKGEGTGRTLLYNGHTDTVPPFDMLDPYRVRIENGKLYGRGAVDMKGPISCMMIAMAGLKRAGIKLKGDLIFAGVIDEEDSSLGTKALIQGGLKTDAAVVGEPTNLNVCIGHKGVEWFETVFTGKAVHAGRPEEGINAIQKAAVFINRIESDLIPRLKKRKHPVIGESTLNYGFIKGGTQPSTVAGECVLQIGRRWIPSEKYEDVVGDFQMIINQLKKEDPSFQAVFRPMEEESMKNESKTDFWHHEAMETDPQHPIVQAAQKSVEDYYERKAELKSFEAWSDGGLLSSFGGIPSIVFGPGSLTSAHSSDEFIEIRELVPAAVLYALIALEFCGVCGKNE